MSVQKVSAIPNVYKLEKFIIVDTIDMFGVNPLEITKPSLLKCLKFYISVDTEGTKREHIDIDTRYYIAVPLSLWQVASLDVDDAGNSLICPPYIASEATRIRNDQTLSEHLVGNDALIHRGSVIYAQRRDYGVDVYGDDGATRQGKADDKIIARYIDVNVDGRTLKISSQTDKSNNVDMSVSNFAPEGPLTNYYSGSSDLTDIESLQKACGRRLFKF